MGLVFISSVILSSRAVQIKSDSSAKSPEIKTWSPKSAVNLELSCVARDEFCNIIDPTGGWDGSRLGTETDKYPIFGSFPAHTKRARGRRIIEHEKDIA